MLKLYSGPQRGPTEGSIFKKLVYKPKRFNVGKMIYTVSQKFFPIEIDFAKLIKRLKPNSPPLAGACPERPVVSLSNQVEGIKSAIGNKHHS